jgi:hypothetical protein
MSGLSTDPEKRTRQLQNLRQGGAPPAPHGNQRRVTHGGYADVATERADAKTADIMHALAGDLPLRDHDGRVPAADMAAVELLARALVRLGDVAEWLTRRGIEDGKGELRTNVLDLERRLRAEAAEHADRLGMTPRSRAALGVDLVRASQRRSPLEEFIDGDAAEARA